MEKTGPPSASDPSSLHLLAAWIDLGDQVLVGRDGAQHSLKSSLLAYEELVVVSAWTSHNQNITHTAAALGVSRRRVRQVVNRWKDSRRDRSKGSPAKADVDQRQQEEEPSHVPADQ